MKISPNDLDASENLSEALVILGDLAKGLEMAEKALGLAEEAEDKAICRFLCISAYLFKGESERAQEEIEGLTDYLRSLEKGFRVTEWDFSTLLPAIQERLEAENKRKLLSIISLLKGEIGLEEFGRRISSKIQEKKRKNKRI